ncbi:hydroxyacid dehydrogenase [Mangrovicella endophytica]|uniref:hydroxyacid dehydrogenase n=1 Tax=Mangrovicella endophytica TaxID=2066697 RepID=UPI001FDF91BF|nr:hydroxyacid dehydrogenase [Mangrovicella endophytica]
MSNEDAPICLIVQPIHDDGLERLRSAGIRPILASASDMATVASEIGEATAVITRNAGLSAAAITAAPRLRVIAVHGVGTDAVSIDAASGRGIPVVNTPGANTQSVAEHAIGLIFALAKALPAGDQSVRRGDHAFRYEAHFTELAGKTFGIVGLGGIGRATAALARALGLRTIGFSARRSDEDFAAAGVERSPSLDALLAASDFVSLHLSLTPETRGLIGARELGLMKPSAFLINTARGGLIDEAALSEALTAGQIAGAGLDVFVSEPLSPQSPLAALKNVVLSPHSAGSTEEALRRMACAAADQVVDVLAGRRPLHLVNERFA